jgi:hypothetical protein
MSHPSTSTLPFRPQVYQVPATDSVDRIPLANSKEANRIDLTVNEMVRGEVAIW